MPKQIICICGSKLFKGDINKVFSCAVCGKEYKSIKEVKESKKE